MQTSNRAMMAYLKDDQRGSVGITFALMSFVMFGTIAIAIDVGRATHDGSILQTSLDAAAIAALRVDKTRQVEVGTEVFNLNMQSARSTPSGLTIEALADGSIKATAEMTVDSITSKLISAEPLVVAGVSVANPVANALTNTNIGEIPCMHVMDQNIPNAFDLDRNMNLDARDCHAYTRSNDTASLRSNNSDNVVFRKIRVKGAANIIGGGLLIDAAPNAVITDAPIVGDPYNRDIDAVQSVMAGPGNCTTANSNRILTGYVPAGTYCESTEFRNATLSGVYYIVSRGASRPGKLKLTGNIQADGITIYMADNSATLAPLHQLADGSVLRAMTTGPTRGVLMMESSNRGSSWPLEFAPAKSQTWQGLLYLPSANVVFNSFEAFPTFNISIAANRLRPVTWKDMPWNMFQWTPYTSTKATTYDPALIATTSASEAPTPIWISK